MNLRFLYSKMKKSFLNTKIAIGWPEALPKFFPPAAGSPAKLWETIPKNFPPAAGSPASGGCAEI